MPKKSMFVRCSMKRKQFLVSKSHTAMALHFFVVFQMGFERSKLDKGRGTFGTDEEFGVFVEISGDKPKGFEFRMILHERVLISFDISLLDENAEENLNLGQFFLGNAGNPSNGG